MMDQVLLIEGSTFLVKMILILVMALIVMVSAVFTSKSKNSKQFRKRVSLCVPVIFVVVFMGMSLFLSIDSYKPKTIPSARVIPTPQEVYEFKPEVKPDYAKIIEESHKENENIVKEFEKIE